MSTQSQMPLISESAEVVELNKMRTAARRYLQETANPAFCKRRPDGQPGCGREIWFATIKGGRTRVLDDNLQTHKCPEIKP